MMTPHWNVLFCSTGGSSAADTAMKLNQCFYKTDPEVMQLQTIGSQNQCKNPLRYMLQNDTSRSTFNVISHK
jgi:hypothetical protein